MFCYSAYHSVELYLKDTMKAECTFPGIHKEWEEEEVNYTSYFQKPVAYSIFFDTNINATRHSFQHIFIRIRHNLITIFVYVSRWLHSPYLKLVGSLEGYGKAGTDTKHESSKETCLKCKCRAANVLIHAPHKWKWHFWICFQSNGSYFVNYNQVERC